MTLPEAFEKAVQHVISARGSPGTRRIYKLNFSRWVAYGETAGVLVTAPSLADAVGFRDHLQATLRPASVRQMLASLSGIYGDLVKLGLVAKNPFYPGRSEGGPALSWPAAADFAKTQAVSEEIAKKMLALAEADGSFAGRRDLAVLQLLYGTGLRRASVAGLRRSHLHREAGRVVVQVIVKGGKEKEAEVPPEAVAAIDRWLEAAPKSDFLFPGKTKGRSICVDLINKIVRERATEAGVLHIHPHQFRAAFITNALDAGVSLTDVRAAAHHQSADMTLRYDRGVRGAGVAGAVEAFRRKKK